jgi:hypothetical protein
MVKYWWGIDMVYFLSMKNVMEYSKIGRTNTGEL